MPCYLPSVGALGWHADAAEMVIHVANGGGRVSILGFQRDSGEAYAHDSGLRRSKVAESCVHLNVDGEDEQTPRIGRARAMLDQTFATTIHFHFATSPGRR